mgnify:CR=1 FL=1
MRFGRSRHINYLLPGTKSELLEILKAKGLELTVERENVGAWNECRNFKVGDFVLDVVMKSDRPDWTYMVEQAKKL